VSLPRSTAAIRAAKALVVGKGNEFRAGDAMPGRMRHVGMVLAF